MSLLRIKCPECGAGLKSAAGFQIGQSVCCPKCETYFAVEEPAEEVRAAKKAVKAAVADVADEDDEDERPRKKKKGRGAAGGDSYKNSPLRFIILGILILILLVLAYFLYEKKKREREQEAARPVPTMNMASGAVPSQGPGARPAPVGGLLGVAVEPVKAKELTAKYTTELIGSWSADLGNGETEEVIYTADGGYAVARTGSGAVAAAGTYTVQELVGTRGLRLRIDRASGVHAITVTFEDDELQHPSLQPGVTVSFRKSDPRSVKGPDGAEAAALE